MSADQASDLPPQHAPVPVDSATILIVDTAGGTPRILMGRRRSDDVFMPDKYVFPGGRVEPGDATAPSADELTRREIQRLLIEMDGTPSEHRARAIALAAIRETFEEAGIVIGASSAVQPMPTSPNPAWSSFTATGFLPSPAALTFVARAITPPGRHRYRYDNRFFCARAQSIVHRTALIDGELVSLDWFTFDEIGNLDLPNITRTILADVADRFAPDGTINDGLVPFYQGVSGPSRRRMIGEAS